MSGLFLLAMVSLCLPQSC